MPFKYSCFISYRASQKDLTRTFIQELKRALESHIDPWLDRDVYVDYERLQGGDFYNEALAKALCESVCMILVFTPKYFSQEHTFCTREYKAMEKLEQVRFKSLAQDVNKEQGFIIPIVFRGLKYLPAEIKQERHFYDFSQYALHNREIITNENYIPYLEQIAERIYNLSNRFNTPAIDPLAHCQEFALPPEAEIKAWLQSVKTTPQFPGRLEVQQ